MNVKLIARFCKISFIYNTHTTNGFFQVAKLWYNKLENVNRAPIMGDIVNKYL